MVCKIDELIIGMCDSEKQHLIVEDSHDVDIFQRLVKRHGFSEVQIHASESRANLLHLYGRRDDFSHVPVVFIADRDMWLFEGIPVGYEDIIFTTGFSIENDIYAEAKLERLLEPHETAKHQQILISAIKVFALEVERYKKQGLSTGYLSLEELDPSGLIEIGLDFRTRHDFFQPDPKLIQYIKENYKLHLRGEWLFQILCRFLNAHGRDFKFDITPRNLCRIALEMSESNLWIDKLMQQVEQKLVS